MWGIFVMVMSYLQLMIADICKKVVLNRYNKCCFAFSLKYVINMLKGYLCYKMTTPQNVLSEAQVKNFFIS